MANLIGRTIEYRNKYGAMVTAVITRTEKLRYPYGATGLYHIVDGKEVCVTYRPDLVKD